MNNNLRKYFISIVIGSVLISALFGSAAGFWAGAYVSSGGDLKAVLKGMMTGENITPELRSAGGKVVTIDQESAVIAAVEEVSPSVVSIIVTRDLPKIRRFGAPFSSDFFRRFFGPEFEDFFNIPDDRAQDSEDGTERREIGGGTGFIVSKDGYIATNKHVVSDERADYTVLLNDGARHPAKVLARDPVSDLAILKIDAKKDLPTVELGDSSALKAGQTVIAIGNALGEFRNTVSTGVISGLARSITAGGAAFGSENLVGAIQTDASINPGNSGGPLLNIAGQVIGINTAIVQGAQNIGFAIPINEAKNTIESVKRTGRIIRPWLGVRYELINKAIAEANKLETDYGALVVRGETESDLAVIPGSPADKAGLVENDIILEVNGKRIDENNPLANAISKLNVGDMITLKVLHRGETKEIKVKLEEMK